MLQNGLKEQLPYASVSGGVSNVSFSFRGNNAVREAMHSAFLYHAIQLEWIWVLLILDMLKFMMIFQKIIDHVEDVLLNRRPDATEALLNLLKDLDKRRK